MGMIDDHAAVSHAISKNNGFWDDEVNVHFLLSKIALLQSEGSELLEGIRKEQGQERILDEMADVYIRLVDLFQGMKQSGWLDQTASLDEAVANKIRVNATRPRKHGNLA
jgi:NTP pyrophosphatase (non-canonical NTP hydrolase)